MFIWPTIFRPNNFVPNFPFCLFFILHSIFGILSQFLKQFAQLICLFLEIKCIYGQIWPKFWIKYLFIPYFKAKNPSKPTINILIVFDKIFTYFLTFSAGIYANLPFRRFSCENPQKSDFSLIKKVRGNILQIFFYFLFCLSGGVGFPTFAI